VVNGRNRRGWQQLDSHRPSFDKLLTGPRTAVANEYKLDKEAISFDDLVDAFRLALTFYKRSKE
jgi:hypothetical protein